MNNFVYIDFTIPNIGLLRHLFLWYPSGEWKDECEDLCGEIEIVEQNQEIQLVGAEVVHAASIWRLANFTHKNTGLPIENEELINQAAHTLFWLELNFPLKNGNSPLKFKMKFLKT